MRWLGLIVLVILIIGLGIFFWPKKVVSPLAEVEFTEHSLEKYDFDALAKRQGKVSGIKIMGNIPEVEIRRKNKYTVPAGRQDFLTREIRFQSDEKDISGMINLPAGRQVISDDNKKRPVIIMIRGYAEKAGYYPGSGTWKVADELARQSAGKLGYMTISLDFLGYGNSDNESSDVLEARFHKVIEVLDLIESVKQLSWVDKNRIGIWAHSNGGQIALSVLEVTGEKYPTVLWAPMTQTFPQSIIDTADEGEERDKATKFVNLFTKYYDARRYAFENYYEWIQAPILIQQGTADTQVKVEWQQSLQSRLKEFGKSSELIIYEGADHNMKGSWIEVVERDVEFFAEML